MAYDLSVPGARNPLIAITGFVGIAVLFTGLRLQTRRIRHVPLPEMIISWLLRWYAESLQLSFLQNR
jgi:hypothetical protein